MGMTIHPLDLGSGIVDSSFLVRGWNPGTPIEAPCLSYLILGSETPIVVDASYRDAAAMNASPGSNFAERSEEQSFAGQLAKFDLRPEDVGLFISTHLHRDHTGLIDKLPNARIAVQRRELEHAATTAGFDRVDIAKLVGPLFERIEFVEERDGDKELAPGVSVVWTGGHSPGHQIVYVELDSGLAVITGDLVNRKNPGLDLQLPPGWITNLTEAMLGLKRITRDAPTHVLPMHDSNVWVEYPDGVIA
ncbi:N-acyl homoserine lactonase family protein [Mycolicibacterium sp. P9-64]|uniref:N-acyl homoserine lactonase family protein n=1 Tax=Mycolicibacterium sp. P9-64 TaxID=2024612 RepID=UPI0011ECF6D9|nr:N-acyl homoserine lactonase family protein [Mycolicibacterium sp. P9-64]KAA0085593.1 N-acyl homoserine lactonase family protein [Mycolicibacterium sp. P9-64]